MATNAVIGALRVTLGADTAAFDKGLKDAEKSLASFQKNMTKFGAAIGVALGSAVVTLGTALKVAINNADELGKTAQKIGIPVEELSKLKHAADLSGVSMETLQGSLTRLSRNMSDAATNATGQAARAFTALGVAVKNSDGTLRSSSDVIQDVAGKFETMKDSAGKTALAVSIFGRAGAELIPLLNAGKAGLQDMGREAEQLGIVIDTRTAKAAEAFNDNMTRLGRVFSGVATQVVAQLSPALQVLTGQTVEYVKANDVARESAERVVAALEFIARAAATTAHFFTSLAREAVALWDVLKAPNLDQLTSAWQRFRDEGQRSEAGLAAIGTSFRDFNEQAKMLSTHLAVAGAAVQTHAAPMIAGTTGAKDAMKLAADEARRWKDETNAVFRAIIEDPLTPYAEKIRAVNKAFQEGIVTQTQWGKLTRDIAKENMGHMLDTASLAATTLTSVFKNNKAAGIAAAIINTGVAVTKSLTTIPLPWGAAMAAMNLAMGAAQISAIKSTKMATGGAMRFANVGSGPDSQLLQARIRPDEQVDIWRPGEGPDPRRGAGGNGAPREVVLRLAGGAPRDFVQWVADGISEAVGDGMTIRVA